MVHDIDQYPLLQYGTTRHAGKPRNLKPRMYMYVCHHHYGMLYGGINPTHPSGIACTPLKGILNPHRYNSCTASWIVTGGRKQKYERDHTYRKNCRRTKKRKKKRSNKRKKQEKKYKISIPTSNITLSSTQPVSTTNITFSNLHFPTTPSRSLG